VREEENRAQLSQQQKDAFYADWFKMQTEMSVLGEEMALERKQQLEEEQRASPQSQHRHAQLVREKIAQEVAGALAREQSREERAVQRMNQMDRDRFQQQQTQTQTQTGS
jgi:hypothetical protein